jgi:high affinity Mn2+ porin
MINSRMNLDTQDGLVDGWSKNSIALPVQVANMRFQPIAEYGALCRVSHSNTRMSTRTVVILAVLSLVLSYCFPFVAMAEQVESQLAAGANTSISTPVQPIASDILVPEKWSVHGQFTNVTQWHPAFKSHYTGQNSLNSRSDSNETTDLTLFAGIRISAGGELWMNPEIDQGFGLSNTFGMAGFPSGEAYKVGADSPYLRLPRLFYRQVVNLAGEEQTVEPAPNQLGRTQSANNVILTIGKISVTDIFDANTYAHDPRADFMNWAIVESGAFDDAADAWGFSKGTAIEWTQSWWTLRGGFFDLSTIPNTTILDQKFTQHEWVGELEERHQLGDHPGKLKLLGYANYGKMGSYQDALKLQQQTGSSAPDTSLVRRFASRPGFAINLEQEVASNMGVFARASMNDGSEEAFDFTEINKSIAAGLSLRGDRWGRHDDTVGVAAVVNGLSSGAQAYFAAGGMGILIGDGNLNYGTEKIFESYYSLNASDHIKLSFDYQYVINPAYNQDRGPVSIYGTRLHAEF